MVLILFDQVSSLLPIQGTVPTCLVADHTEMLTRTLPEQALFRTPEQKIKTGSLPHLNLVSPERFDAFLRAILTFLAANLLLVPVIILFELQPTDKAQLKSQGRFQILVVFLFTMTFSACCSIFTKARKQEVFTATAAYSAVLVVFLGNTSNFAASNTQTSVQD